MFLIIERKLECKYVFILFLKCIYWFNLFVGGEKKIGFIDNKYIL